MRFTAAISYPHSITHYAEAFAWDMMEKIRREEAEHEPTGDQNPAIPERK